MARRRRSADGSTAPEDLVRFVREQHPRVEGALALFTGDPVRAQDVAQEAFVRVCERWEQVSRMDAPGAWVHRVAMNLALSGFRRAGAEQRANDRHLRRVDTVSGSGGHEDRCVVAADVAAVLRELDEPHRAVVVLRFFADLSVEETATALGIPEGTVKTRTRNALAALRGAGLLTEVVR